MTFNPQIAEAQLALDRIGTTDMPRLAWEAIEAGLDGPAIRRLAALQFPTFFEVREILPAAMREMGVGTIEKPKAAYRLAKLRAQQILASDADPMKHLLAFELLWRESDYSEALAAVGYLDEEVYVARWYERQPETQIRSWVSERVRQFATG
jgi:hypothetical protein